MAHLAEKPIPKAANLLLMFLLKISFPIFLFASLNSKLWLDCCQGAVLFFSKEYLYFKSLAFDTKEAHSAKTHTCWSSKLQTYLCKQVISLEHRHVFSVIILRNSIVPVSSSIVTRIQLPTFSALQLSSELHIFFSFQACYNSEACSIL